MTSAYTPLETLLLFQALRAEGTGNAASINFSFNRISEQLKSISLIRNDPSYHGGRLSPDALREQFLWLLKEEAKRDVERATQQQNGTAHANTNGDTSPNSKKRKAPSPTLPTVQEAAQHSHLIPQLVSRLYATYREKTVKEIREYERKYDALSRDITDIEAGKWDERLQRQRNVSATQSPKPSTSAHTQPIVQRAESVQQAAQNATGTPTPAEKPVEPNAQAPPKRYSQAKIDAVMNHGPEPSPGHGGHRRTSSNTTLPPLSEMAPQSPRFGIPPLPGPVTAMGMQQPYAQSPPIAHQSPYAPHHGHPVASPQLQNVMARPSSSPRPILPPPPGMKFPPPQSPIQHVTSPGMRGPPLQPQQHYQPHHRGSIGPSPTNDRPPHQFPPPQLPPPQGYYQPPQQYPDRRTSYPPPHPQPQPVPRYTTQPSHQGGYQLQPWMVDANQQSRTQPKQQPPPPQQQTPRPQQPPAHASRPPSYPQYPSAPPTAARPPQAQPRLISDIISALATPPRAERKPVWKSERRPPPMKVPSPPAAPDIEPLSPVQQRAQPPARTSRSTRTRGAAPSVEHDEAEAASLKGRRRRTRNRSPHSVVSSSADDLARTHTRSLSVSTIAGTLQPSEDRRGSRGDIKAEPSTPAEMPDAPEHASEPSATTPLSGRMTRKRRGTLQSQPQPPSKRKRQLSPYRLDPSEGSEAAGTPPPRPTTVSATRNFGKITGMLLNDIESHKHGNLFQSPVRDNDASGYSEIIKRPQNIKSIRKAIIAGTKAVAAATANMDSPAATPTLSSSRAAQGSSTVELERTADLIPPKAIVNGAQLEKEVYRMCANAVMFNPGEDGLVADTREMFEYAEAKIREWRGAETGPSGGGGEEEEVEGKGKRRKL